MPRSSGSATSPSEAGARFDAHASGVADERAAECHGLQWLARTAAEIGGDRAYAERLARADWAHYDRLPRMYCSNECKDGGELDLDEGSAHFP